MKTQFGGHNAPLHQAQFSRYLLGTYIKFCFSFFIFVFARICSLIPSQGTIYLLSLGLNLHWGFLLPCIVNSEGLPPLWMGQK